MPFRQKQLDNYPYLEGQVRCGRVTKVSTDNCIAATVTYPDRGYQSNYMTVLQRNTVGVQDFYVPTEGEPVWVLQFGKNRGLILGSAYTDGHAPPWNSGTIRGIKFVDGTYVIYDTAGGGNYQINTPGQVTVTAKGNVNVTTQASATVTATTKITLKCGNITLDGDVLITKTLQVEGETFLLAQATATPSCINQDGSGGGT